MSRTRKSPAPAADNSKSTAPITKIRHKLPDACKLLGISLGFLYERIQEGALKTVTDGRRRYITDAELRRYGEQSH